MIFHYTAAVSPGANRFILSRLCPAALLLATLALSACAPEPPPRRTIRGSAKRVVVASRPRSTYTARYTRFYDDPAESYYDVNDMGPYYGTFGSFYDPLPYSYGYPYYGYPYGRGIYWAPGQYRGSYGYRGSYRGGSYRGGSYHGGHSAGARGGGHHR